MSRLSYLRSSMITPAAKRRKIVAHGVSRGTSAAPPGLGIAGCSPTNGLRHGLRSLAAPRLVAVWLLFCIGAWSWSQAAEPSELQTLIAQLQSDASQQQKLTACRRLAVIGTKDAVPALAAMLADEQLSHPARIALEAIPDPAAVEALRGAIPHLKGQRLVGVTNSLGVRRDAAALPSLRRLLADGDAQVVCAAATALGRIGTPEAAQVLTAELTSAQGPVREAVGDACLRCAELLAAEGNRQASLGVYDPLRQAQPPNESVRRRLAERSWAGRPLAKACWLTRSSRLIRSCFRSP